MTVQCPDCALDLPGESLLSVHRERIHPESNYSRGIEAKRALDRFIQNRYKAGQSQRGIARELVELNKLAAGQDAGVVVGESLKGYKEAAKKDLTYGACKDLALGLLIGGVGGAVTAAALTSDAGGVILYGATVVGGLYLLRGIYRLIRSRTSPYWTEDE